MTWRDAVDEDDYELYDEDDWYDDDPIQDDPDYYDEPSCGRCYDTYEVPARLRWLHPYGVRPCPDCNAGPIRYWWWRHIGRRWSDLRWRLKHGRPNFDDEAPF